MSTIFKPFTKESVIGIIFNDTIKDIKVIGFHEDGRLKTILNDTKELQMFTWPKLEDFNHKIGIKEWKIIKSNLKSKNEQNI